MIRTKVLALGFGVTLGLTGIAAAIPTTSWAADCPTYPASTCITPGVTIPPATTSTGNVAFTNDGSALPFTGADIEQLSAVGGVALIGGTLLVARSRRRRRADA